MSENGMKLTYGVQVNKIWEGFWSFGLCLSKTPEEFYLYINLFKWQISIGRIWKEIPTE